MTRPLIISQGLVILVLLFCCSVVRPVPAADWPGFRGPNGDCTSDEKELMKTWPAEGPEVLWTGQVGVGFGGVAVEDGKVYMLDRDKGKRDILRCLDLNTGRELWRFGYDAVGNISYPGSRSHPTVDSYYVYTMSVFGQLHCVSKETHKPVWARNILKEFGMKRPTWAISQAPVIYKDKVIAAPITDEVGLVAFDKLTGRTVWKSPPLAGRITYASAIVTNIHGVDQVLALTTSCIAGIDAETGAILWTNGDWECRIPVASPAYIGHGHVFVTGGYRAGVIMLEIRREGNRFTATTKFKTNESNGQIHQPIVYKDHIYVNGNDKSKRDGLVCMDFDGNIKWKTGRSPGFDWGGMLLADDMLYVVDGNKGDLCMVRPDPSAYREVARFNLLKGKQIWGTIALSDGKLLLRDQSQLRCVDVRGG